jgi:hypothetical protein
LDQNRISVVKRVCERRQCLIVCIWNQPRRGNVAFALVERGYETFRIGYHDDLKVDSQILRKSSKQLVFVAERFPLIDEIGGGIVRSDYGDRSAFAN